LAVDQVSRGHHPSRLVSGVQWLIYHLFSLETLLLLFVFGVRLQALLPRTPMPETVFYGLLSLAVGAWVIWREGIYLRGIPIFLAGLAFSGWMFASYGWSPSQVLARESLPFVMGVNLWATFAAACIVAGSRERLLRFLLMLMLLSVALSAYGAYVSVFHGDFRYYYGPSGLWHHRTYLDWGYLIGVGSPIALALLIYSRFGSVKQVLAASACGVCFYFMLVNGARGAMLGAMLAGIVAFLINMPTIRRGQIEISPALLGALLAIASIGGYIGYLVSIGETPATFDRFLRLFDQADDALLRRGPNRFDYFSGAYQAWLQAPIFGHGLAGFPVVFCGWDAPGCHPHNVLLQALAEFGLIGLVLFLLFVWMGLRHHTLQRLRHDPLQMTVLMAFIGVLMYALVAADLPVAHRVFFFIGLLPIRPPPDDDEDDDDLEDDEL
jgi:O-antigen ligase